MTTPTTAETAAYQADARTCTAAISRIYNSPLDIPVEMKHAIASILRDAETGFVALAGGHRPAWGTHSRLQRALVLANSIPGATP